MWSVVGHLLGVDPRLMPSSFDEGSALMETIWRRQFAESEAGTVLTAALIESMRGALGPALRGAPPSLIRHFCGDELADLLAVPPSDWTALAIELSSDASLGYGKLGDRSQLAATLSSKVGELLLSAALRVANRGNRYDWTVPESEAQHRQG
ncbi:MAG: oxygenase MpaB family protein [Pseudonocardiales bacterium]